MPELAAFDDHHNRRRGRRDTSPDSVIDQDTSLYSSSGGIRGPDPDLKQELTARNNGNGGPYLNVEKAAAEEVAIKLNMDAAENQMHILTSPRSSFSYKEYQSQKLRSDRRRPASFDLNNQAMNVTSSSPRLTSAMKISASARRTPYYQKGRSSERVPLNTNTNKSTLMVYNNNWKALSSKWEDAERWIVSPVAGDEWFEPFGSTAEPDQVKEWTAWAP
ncbi:uncharacterized protein LOC143606882 [Bidens hawaiensis]|uniref:uncharacterized protein LOC143606882 n=1 Tax=Bidens hawaiensis TaxID=980011 RepID=UPI00404B0D58